jgi:alpha-N-arabinofuranosidase
MPSTEKERFMNRIKIDLDRRISSIDRNIFGGFVEHFGRCIYGGMYQPGSPLSDEDGFRTDVMSALHRLQVPIMRYPGGNFVSGYRWMDGVGRKEERPARLDLAWGAVESNHFGTNEFIRFCRKLNTEPYLVVNCGDGDMREARDWVEYCNGTQETALVKLRRQHGFEAPHGVKYWGIGNEVDGEWQIGYKTPEAYARAYAEFAKVMKWVDPSIHLIAAVTSLWEGSFVERAQLLIEQAGKHIDYMAIHWYVSNSAKDFNTYMALSELFEERLSAYEGLIHALCLQQGMKRPIPIAVDEWNVTHQLDDPEMQNSPEHRFNLEDALVVALQLNAFIRHAASVRMANLAQLVNVLAPIFTSPEGMFLQPIFFPLEVYSRTCGSTALDAYWTGDTFSGGSHTALRVLDVAAALDEGKKSLSVYVVNRSQTDAMETTITLEAGSFAGAVGAYVVNAADIKAENTFANPNQVGTTESGYTADKQSSFTYTFEPHSSTALVFAL